MILIDLQKVFYALDHKFLLEKVKCIDFPGKTENNKMVSFLPHKQSRFCFIEQFVFKSRDH